MPTGSGYVLPLLQLSHKSGHHDQIRRSKQFLLIHQQPPRLLPIHTLEANLVAWPQLSQATKIRRNHVRNLCISARGLLLHKQDDRQSPRWYLHRPERNTFGNHLSVGALLNRGTLEPQPHAIGFLRHTKRAPVKQLLRRFRKPLTLRPWRDAQDFARRQPLQGLRSQRPFRYNPPASPILSTSPFRSALPSCPPSPLKRCVDALPRNGVTAIPPRTHK